MPFGLSRLSFWEWVRVVGLVLAIGASFALDWQNLARGGAIDLRNRVTGARLLVAGLDPYHYKWVPGEPALFCDPYNNPALPVSQTTATPALLALLQAPLAALPYRSQQVGWLLAQWLLLVALLAGWIGIAPSRRRAWILAAALIGFTFTAAWRLHAEHGQAYLVLTAGLTAWIVLCRAPIGATKVWSGLLLGLLVALRPSTAVLLPLLLAGPGRGQLPGALAGLLAGFGLPCLFRPTIWLDYFRAMQQHAALYFGQANPTPPPQAFPAVVEGLPIDLLGGYAPIPFADSSLFALWRATAIPPLSAIGPGLFALLFGLWFWRVYRLQIGPRAWQLGGIAWVLLADFFLPAYRYPYNDLWTLALVGLLFTARPAELPGRRLLSLARALLLGSIVLGWAVAALVPRGPLLIVLPSIGFALAAALCLLATLRPGNDLEQPPGDGFPAKTIRKKRHRPGRVHRLITLVWTQVAARSRSSVSNRYFFAWANSRK